MRRVWRARPSESRPRTHCCRTEVRSYADPELNLRGRYEVRPGTIAELSRATVWDALIAGSTIARSAQKKRREAVRAQCALQSIRNSPLDAGVLTRPILLFADWLLAQSFRLAEVAPLSVRRSRYAAGRFLGFAVFLRRIVPEAVKFPTIPLYEFRLRLEPFPASPSRPGRSTGRLLSWASLPFST